MRVPLSWIRDFAPFEGDPSTLAETLDDLGLVVEGVAHVGKGLEDVVVARVLEIAAIPGADKIRQVTVEAGAGPLSIVCGAWNFAVGDLVPLAPVGAVLPGDFEITTRKMKGVTSNGMLCSGRELELTDDHDGILIIGAGPSPGERFVDALGIVPDVVFDIAVEANRPDAWCMAGVARDLAARLRLPFAVPEPPDPPAPPDPSVPGSAPTPLVSVVVVDDDLCPRFTARVLTGIEVRPSPAWMARRLTLAGMRPINNVVDASNYVMLELGQPTHPYDLDRVAGHGLRVRAAHTGETVTTLDGVERRLGDRAIVPSDDRRDCVICDATDAPLGIGGIMGGGSSEISDSTSRVLLEAAYFAPMAIARTTKRLGLRSEASARFERGCDPEGIDRAARRLCEVLGSTAGPAFGVAPPVVDVRGPVPGPCRVEVRTNRVNTILGSTLDDDAVTSYLEPIGFACRRAGEGVLDVTVPTFRPDTWREIDVIEEVARHHGYGALPRRRPAAPQVGGLTTHQKERRLVRAVLAGFGAHEAWTPSLLAADDHGRAGLGPGGVEVANPLTPDETVLRRSLLPGMLKALAFNADRRQDDLRLFEIGHVFPPPDAGRVERAFARTGETVIDEREMVAAAFAGTDDDAYSAAGAWLALADALGVDGVDVVQSWTPPTGTGGGLHPTRAAALVVRADSHDTVIGVVGEVDPGVLRAFGLDPGRQRVGWLEIDLDRLLDDAHRRRATVTPISRFPSSDVDLAFVVDDGTAAAEVAGTLRRAGGDLLESLGLFDVYRGPGLPPGTRSLAYRLRFCALDHTLTDVEVGELRGRCIEAVEQAHGASLRT
ncbi:MAG TPA: phenylalanine--tRNA ligase subunit beta [Acidimicrobiales bacterium]|nr:phenylalanine--tRNA ligase subunit beta [Acidimicrobiales bacterium]